MATDISAVGGLIKVTKTGVNPKYYTINSIPPYQFTSNNELIFAGYTIALADLRIEGAGSAPVSVSAAETALEALFPEAGGSASTTYLVYTALLSQSGTDAPVATVLENTLGETVVWTRDSLGVYYGTFSDNVTGTPIAPPFGSDTLVVQPIYEGAVLSGYYQIFPDNDKVILYTFSTSFSAAEFSSIAFTSNILIPYQLYP